MITYRIVRALQKPPITHPLFQRIINQPNRVLPWYAWLIALIILPYMILMIVIFSATTFGIRWLIDIHNTLSREIKQGTYTLLTVTPSGKIGTQWLIILGIMYRGNAFQRLNNLGFWAGRLLMVLTGVYVFLNPSPSPGQFPTTNHTPLEVKITLVCILLLGFVIHHYQSITLCALIALLIPTFTYEARTAPLIAVGLFIITQFVSYLMTFIIGFLIAPSIIKSFELPTAPHDITQMIVQLLIFVVIREVIITAYWIITRQRYEHHDTKSDFMLTISPNILNESIA